MLIGLTTTENEEREAKQVNQKYLACVLKSGAMPILIPPINEQKIDGLLDHLDGIILTGGGDVDPLLYKDLDISPKTIRVSQEHDMFEIALALKAYKRNLPTFGICRGMQIMNVAFGGSLYQDILACNISQNSHLQDKPYDTLVHSVSLDPASFLAKTILPSNFSTTILVNSIHHQAIKNVASPFNITAQSSDGIIEAIEVSGKTFFLGVQWHPEYLQDHQVIFDKFVESIKSK